MDKVAMLNQVLTQDPANAFARYGLAMEFAGRGETATAITEFERLLHDHPDYTPGYHMAAQTMARAGESQRAIGYLRLGLECAQRTGNLHALSEMQSMLAELEDQCL